MILTDHPVLRTPLIFNVFTNRYGTAYHVPRLVVVAKNGEIYEYDEGDSLAEGDEIYLATVYE